VQSKFGQPVGRLRAPVHPIDQAGLGSGQIRAFRVVIAPGTLLVLISLHARFPSPESRDAPTIPDMNPPCQRASRCGYTLPANCAATDNRFRSQRVGWLRTVPEKGTFYFLLSLSVLGGLLLKSRMSPFPRTLAASRTGATGRPRGMLGSFTSRRQHVFLQSKFIRLKRPVPHRLRVHYIQMNRYRQIGIGPWR
jgi:hypothetical protein